MPAEAPGNLNILIRLDYSYKNPCKALNTWKSRRKSHQPQLKLIVLTISSKGHPYTQQHSLTDNFQKNAI